MNKKLLELMKVKCKDMGLSEKAIEEIVSNGGKSLTDTSTDAEIETEASSLAGFAKAMQGESTRWAQKQKADLESKQKADLDAKQKADLDASAKVDLGEPAWFTAYKQEQSTKFDALQKQNDLLAGEKKASDRKAAVGAKVKELGISEVLMQRFHIGDDEDIDTVLTAYKQELVNSKLLPAVAESGAAGSNEQAQQVHADEILKRISVSGS